MAGLAEEELARPRHARWLRLGGGLLLAAALLLAALVILLQGLGSGTRGVQRQMTRITVLPDTPPPPPPKEEMRPDSPKAEPKETKAEPPKEPTPQAQGETLKMEGAAGDGPSPFVAGTVTRENVLAGGERMAFAFYTNGLQRYLQEALAKDKRLRGADYRLIVRLWLGGDGSIRRVELAGSSGNPEVDAQVRSALGALAAVPDAPPANMPQPVRLRISNRGAG